MPPKGIVLSGDPGPKNFAFAVGRYTPTSYKCLGTGMLPFTITDIVHIKFPKQMKKFRRFWIRLIKKYKPDIVVCERFLVRLFGTSNIELIGIMLGIIAEICARFKIEFRMIVSSQWKNSISKQYGSQALANIYDEIGGTHIPIPKRIPPHRMDAALIGAYTAMGNDFGKFKIPRLQIIKQVSKLLQSNCKSNNRKKSRRTT